LTDKMAHDDLVCPAASSRLQSSGTPLALCPLHGKPWAPVRSARPADRGRGSIPIGLCL